MMNEHRSNKLIAREVCDPADRKVRTWWLTFSQGVIGKIIRKHIANPDEPWDTILKQSQMRSLGSSHETGSDREALQQSLLDHAATACKRPQALAFDEIREMNASDSVRCCLLVCHCGLLIAVRNIDIEPKIHTAYFRRSVAHALAPQRWKNLVKHLRNEHVVADRQSGKLAYPALDVLKEVEDDEHPEQKYWRTRIEFLSKYTWGFVELAGVWRPIAEIPAWEPKP